MKKFIVTMPARVEFTIEVKANNAAEALTLAKQPEALDSAEMHSIYYQPSQAKVKPAK